MPGRIVETGALHDMVKSLAHPYTRGLLASTIHGSRRGTRLEAIPGHLRGSTVFRPAALFAPRCSLADAACSQGEIPPVLLAPQRSARCIKLAPEVIGNERTSGAKRARNMV